MSSEAKAAVPPSLLLGYEVGSGRAVGIPLRHMAVTGITQRSGKTTTLEALIGRSSLRAVTFITKRGEASFSGREALAEGNETASRIPAFFRPGCDWQSVTALLEAHLGETLTKSLRTYLMRACSGQLAAVTVDARPRKARRADDDAPHIPATTIAEVGENLCFWLAQADNAGERNAFFVLYQYFATLLPELARVPTSSALVLRPGLNVMDLSGYSVALQSVVIGSTIDWIGQHETGVITIIPEAWEFIPREGSTACKQAIIRLARKGGCLDNFIWVDSQDLASIDIEVRKMLSVYLLGVQRERNEVQRTLAHIPADLRKPTAKAIMELGRGEFWAVYDQELRCCYVQPPWLDDDPERAREYAHFKRPPSFVAPPKSASTKKKHLLQTQQSGRTPARAMSSEPAPVEPPISGRVQ